MRGAPVPGAGSGRPGVAWRRPAGRVRAGAAVLAVGPAARGACAPLRSRLTVTSSHIVLTEPVPDVIAELGWTGGECITDGRTLLHYFRTTRDGRILLGWGGGRLAYGARVNGRVEVDRERSPRETRAAPAADVPRRSGPPHHARVGRADRRLPQPHRRRSARCPGAPVHFAFGYTGNGVGPTHLAGRALASLALGRRDAATPPRRSSGPDAGAWVPPEPLAWLGGSLVRGALMRRERHRERRRAAGLADARGVRGAAGARDAPGALSGSGRAQ